jgi:CysZ protein
MLETVKLAAAEILGPRFRAVLFKSLGLALVLLALVWAALFLFWRVVVLDWLVTRQWLAADSWGAFALTLLVGAGFVVLLAILTLPVLRFVAGNYLDEVAGLIEKEHYPGRGPPRAVPLAESAGANARFAARTLLLNLLMLPFALVPILGPVAIFLVNAHTVGREYYMLAASRRREPADTARKLRERRWTIWAAGGAIAALSAVPLVNLFAPIFGTSLMVHLDERLGA